MNEITLTEDEPDVIFKMSKILFYQYLYNLRVSFPTEVVETTFCYLHKSVMLGNNYCSLESLRTATCKGCATDAAKLFTLREFSSSVDFSDETNRATILINNLEREEDIAVERRPLD